MLNLIRISSLAAVLALLCPALHAQEAQDQAPVYQAPSDDQLTQEERDAQVMQAMNMKAMQDQAHMTGTMKEEQERAATAQRMLYEGVLEQQRIQSGQMTPEEQLARAMKSGAPNPQSALANGIRAYQSPMAQGMAPQTQLPGGTQGSEQARAIDAMAQEDGPEVAREKGLGFVPMGTIADVRLLTAVNTSIPGVVVGQLVYDIWDADMRYIVIPRGSKLLGQSASMGSDSERGGKVVFHTFIDPTGKAIPIATPVIASDRIGIVGLPGHTSYHWGKILGGSIALAVVSAFAGGNSQATTSATANNGDLIRQGMVQNIGQGSQQLLQRFSKILPDITIEEGTIAKIILVTPLMAKPYRTAWPLRIAVPAVRVAH